MQGYLGFKFIIHDSLAIGSMGLNLYWTDALTDVNDLGLKTNAIRLLLELYDLNAFFNNCFFLFIVHSNVLRRQGGGFQKSVSNI